MIARLRDLMRLSSRDDVLSWDDEPGNIKRIKFGNAFFHVKFLSYSDEGTVQFYFLNFFFFFTTTTYPTCYLSQFSSFAFYFTVDFLTCYFVILQFWNNLFRQSHSKKFIILILGMLKIEIFTTFWQGASVVWLTICVCRDNCVSVSVFNNLSLPYFHILIIWSKWDSCESSN